MSLARTLNWLLDGLYPQHCLSCLKEGSLFCATCQNLVPKKRLQHCILCKKITPEGTSCTYCHEASHVTKWVAVSALETKILAKLIHAFKHEGKKDLSTYLGGQLGEVVRGKAEDGEEWLVCFMPLSVQKLWGRPYNHATLLAREVGRVLGIPMYDILGRKHAPRNHHQDTFYCKYPLFAAKVILVDDVVTTGATMSAAARALKEAGASEILALSIV